MVFCCVIKYSIAGDSIFETGCIHAVLEAEIGNHFFLRGASASGLEPPLVEGLEYGGTSQKQQPHNYIRRTSHCYQYHPRRQVSRGNASTGSADAATGGDSSEVKGRGS
jgi:hypothetical protein